MAETIHGLVTAAEVLMERITIAALIVGPVLFLLMRRK